MDINSGALAASLYRTVWRWHFFAGLLAIPFLVMLAVTGGAYLFKPELDHWIYRAIEDVPPRSIAFAPASQVIARVEKTMDGRVLEFTPSAAPNRAVRLLVRGPSGEPLTAFADPYDGAVTGSMPYGGIMQLVRKIHSLQKFGFWASSLIELTAGWTIALVGTGIFLWWPRGRAGGMVTVRGSPRERIFWRDLHAVTGVLAGGVILFLALTGMPWSMFWGAHVQQWATAAHLNVPEPPADVTPQWAMAQTMPDMPHSPHASDPPATTNLPWAMQTVPAPESRTLVSADAIGIDRAIAIFSRLRLDRTASITLPEGPKGSYVATWRPDRVEDTRVVYVDQYSGKVLGDIGFKEYGLVGKSIEWGIAVHQGQQYGAVNRYVMLMGCVAIILSALSAVTMWWQRRPAGSLGIPMPSPGKARGFLGIMAGVAVLFPLVGISIAAVAVTNLSMQVIRRARVL